MTNSQDPVSAYFDAGPWQDYVRSLIEIYRRRRDVMLDSLAEAFPRDLEALGITDVFFELFDAGHGGIEDR